MTAVFADDFYWTALTHPSDFHREQALTLESEPLGRRLIVTTEELLVEYLAFFADSGFCWRSPAAAIVRGPLHEPGIQVLPQSAETFAYEKDSGGLSPRSTL